MKDWIDFAELRKQLVFSDVLASYDVTLTPKGNTGQHTGTCPLPSHEDAKGQTFSANFEKGIWQCFGCRESGNVIDFAVLMEERNRKNGKDVRAVAVMLRDRFVKKAAPDFPLDRPRSNDAAADAPKTVVNQPLDFALKTLEIAHPFFAEQNLSAETVSRFGLGFCKRGSLAGRIAVPLHDDQEQLVGYAGLLLDPKEDREDNPRYLLPAPREHDGVKHVFDAGKLLYNGFRIGKIVRDLIVVRECHTVWGLWQGGFANVVALMGDECSEEQATLLTFLTSDNARVWLLTDSSPESTTCAETLLMRVASSRLCRWVKVGKEQDIAPDHPFLAVLPKR